MKSRPTVLLAVGFVLGELAFIIANMYGLIFIAVMIAAVLLCTRNKKLYLFILFMIIGYIRIYISELSTSTDTILKKASLSSESISYECNISSYEKRDDKIIIKSDKILIYHDDISLDIKVGNRIRIHGKISAISHATNYGQFDFASYYKSQDIAYRSFADDIIIIDNSYNPLMQMLHDIRAYCRKVISSTMDERDAGFVIAALLGDKSLLPDDIYNLYRDNGIAHLLAISGLHMAVLGMGLYKILRKIGMNFTISGTVASIILMLYCTLVGSSSGVKRAVCMMIILFIGEALGRSYDMLSSICMAAMIILIANPYELLQCGFQLSFMAVLSIAIPTSIITKHIGGSSIRDTIILSAIVQLYTIPIIVYYFFSVPIFAIILNIIVIPFMAYVLISGILVCILYAISHMLSYIASLGAHGIIEIYTKLCTMISNIPHTTILVGRPYLWQIVLYYLILIMITYAICRYKSKIIRGICIFISAFSILILFHIRSDKLQITFLDVGQGDAICAISPDATYMIDAGSSSDRTVAEYIIMPFLRASAIDEIDIMFLTHADADHTNAAIQLLESDYIDIRNICLPILALGDESYNDIRDAALDAGTNIYYIKKDDNIGRFRCIYPSSDNHAQDMNDQSLILSYDYDNFRAIFTGDASISAESSIINSSYIKDATILKVGHHGSSTSSSEEFIDKVSPHISILSYGAGNRYGHPHAQTIDILRKSGTNIYETALDGAITITSDGKSISIDTFISR